MDDFTIEELKTEPSSTSPTEKIDDSAKATETPTPDTKTPEEGTPKFQVPKITDQDALELAETLSGMGVTKSNANILLENANNYKTMAYLLENNPTEVLNLLERSNPAAAQRMLEKITDAYLERNPPPDEKSADSGKGTRSRGTTSVEDSPVIRAMQAELAGFKNVLATAQQQQQYNNLKRNYNEKIGQYIDNVKAGDVTLTTRDKKAVRALLNDSLSNDPEALARIKGGYFADIPRHLQSVLNDWTNDTTSAAASDKASREGVVERGTKNPSTTGAVNTAGTDSGAGSDSWEQTITSMAAALKSGSGSKR